MLGNLCHLVRVLFLTLLLCTSRAAADQPPPPQSVLWIGNSFTYYNGSIPVMVKRLAEDRKPPGIDRLQVAMKAAGGAHMPDHARRTDLGLSGGWDIVVLQGYSDEPVNPAKTAAFRRALAALAERVHTSGAGPMLFMTWAYKNEAAMTDALAAAYTDAAREVGAQLAPVGLAFAAARSARPGLALYVAEDNKHPSAAGTYLAACTFYARLFGLSPQGAAFAPPGMAERDAAFLQRIAWETVQGFSGPSGAAATADGGS